MFHGPSQNSLAQRFPHLRHEIRLLAKRDSSFGQLNEDYKLLLRSLVQIDPEAEADREEMLGLKTSLEVEALERLSQSDRLLVTDIKATV